MGKVLAVNANEFVRTGGFQGFSRSPSVRQRLSELWLGARFLERDEAEKDERYKQLIGYCVVKSEDHPGKILTYRRPNKTGDPRLQGRMSIGFGGHVEPRDFIFGLPISSADMMIGIEKSLCREIEEELGLTAMTNLLLPVGLINYDGDAVGRVHLGVAFELTLISGVWDFVESDEVSERKFMSFSDVLAVKDQLEPWSLMFLEGHLGGSKFKRSA